MNTDFRAPLALSQTHLKVLVDTNIGTISDHELYSNNKWNCYSPYWSFFPFKCFRDLYPHGDIKSVSVRCTDINRTLFSPWYRASPRGCLVSATRPTGLASCSLDRGRPAVHPVQHFGNSMHGEGYPLEIMRFRLFDEKFIEYHYWTLDVQDNLHSLEHFWYTIWSFNLEYRSNTCYIQRYYVKWNMKDISTKIAKQTNCKII